MAQTKVMTKKSNNYWVKIMSLWDPWITEETTNCIKEWLLLPLFEKSSSFTFLAVSQKVKHLRLLRYSCERKGQTITRQKVKTLREKSQTLKGNNWISE